MKNVPKRIQRKPQLKLSNHKIHLEKCIILYASNP